MRPVPYPFISTAVAKYCGRPGSTSSGGRTYGTMFSGAAAEQPVRPASASEAPIKDRNSRRLTSSYSGGNIFRSPVAYRTVGQLCRRIDMVLLNQCAAEL